MFPVLPVIAVANFARRIDVPIAAPMDSAPSNCQAVPHRKSRDPLVQRVVVLNASPQETDRHDREIRLHLERWLREQRTDF